MNGSETISLAAEPEHPSVEKEGIEVFDILIILAEYWKLIVAIVVGAMILGAIVSLLMRPTFRAEAIILPPQQQQSALAGMMGQLGALASLGGAGSLLKNPADMYVGILESRTIEDRLIERFHLQRLYKTKTMQATRLAVKDHVQFEAEKSGLIRITVKDHDPLLASNLANGFVDELHQMNSNLAISEAAQRRLFFDQQISEEKTALTQAETDLKTTQEKTGLIQLSGQAESIIRSIAAMRAEISSRQVTLEATLTFATDQNRTAIRLQQEIATLKAQLAKLENSQQAMQPGDIQVPAGRVPGATLEYARKYRDFRYHEQLFELLSKELEAARIDEAKSAPLIQVVDRAVPLDQKAGPHRTLLTLGFGFVGLCLACLFAFASYGFKKWKGTPAGTQRLQMLRAAFRGSAAIHTD